MTSSTPGRSILPEYDFTKALSLPVQERFARSVATVAAMHAQYGDAELWESLPIPAGGATVEELDALERELGLALPDEYHAFLLYKRYFEVDRGAYEVWGLGPMRDRPWVSTEHPTPGPCLVIGNYWRYADGDQLLLLLDQPQPPVVLYLHEHGPRLETYAPSLSLAVWRMAHESF